MSELKTFEDLTPAERGDETRFVSDLSPHERKAEAATLHDPGEKLFTTKCRECFETMWTWSLREDVCEACMYMIRDSHYELAAKQNKEHPAGVNPFTGQNDRGTIPVFANEAEAPRMVNPYAEAPERRPITQLNESAVRIPNPFKV